MSGSVNDVLLQRTMSPCREWHNLMKDLDEHMFHHCHCVSVILRTARLSDKSVVLIDKPQLSQTNCATLFVRHGHRAVDKGGRSICDINCRRSN